MTDTKTEVMPATRSGEPKAMNQIQKLAQVITAKHDSFAQVATKYMTAERLVKLAHLAISKNPDIAECTTISVLECLMTCARLGLEPNEPGGVWLVPFKKVCTSIVDYRGLVDVARRSDAVTAVHSDIRYEKDQWVYAIDTAGPTMVTLKHSPADGNRGPMLGAYFVAKLKTGECQAVYLSKEQVDRFRGRSKADSYGFSPWKTDYEAMAMKTACRRGVNLLPRTPELQMLREEIHKEDAIDAEMIGDLPEGSQDAIERMLGEIGRQDKALSDGIAAAFSDLGYGPARKLQLLTRHLDDPKALLAWLQREQGGKAADPPKAIEEAKPVERFETTTTKQEPEPVKRKAGRPKGSGKKQPAETKAAERESKPANPEPVKKATADFSKGPSF